MAQQHPEQHPVKPPQRGHRGGADAGQVASPTSLGPEQWGTWDVPFGAARVVGRGVREAGGRWELVSVWCSGPLQ